MADGNVHLHPAVERMELRRKMVAAVDTLLAAVDLLVRELDSDAPDPDLEPSLGMTEYPDHLNGLGNLGVIYTYQLDGSADDREADGDRWTATDADMEPSLGSAPAVNQRKWARGGSSDLEHEHDGREPQCEDEGAACEDEGAIEYECVPTYTSPHDQRRMKTPYAVFDVSGGAR